MTASNRTAPPTEPAITGMSGNCGHDAVLDEAAAHVELITAPNDDEHVDDAKVHVREATTLNT